jgi:hypothetical protein
VDLDASDCGLGTIGGLVVAPLNSRLRLRLRFRGRR